MRDLNTPPYLGDDSPNAPARLIEACADNASRSVSLPEHDPPA